MSSRLLHTQTYIFLIPLMEIAAGGCQDQGSADVTYENFILLSAIFFLKAVSQIAAKQ